MGIQPESDVNKAENAAPNPDVAAQIARHGVAAPAQNIPSSTSELPPAKPPQCIRSPDSNEKSTAAGRDKTKAKRRKANP